MSVVTSMRIMFALFLIGSGHPLSGYPLKYTSGVTYKYLYSTQTVLNSQDEQPRDVSSQGSDSQSGARRDVGFQFTASVEITPVWNSGSAFVMKLVILNPRLHSISRPGLSRELQTLPRLPVYFEWEAGRIGRVFVCEDDTTLSVNIKKGIVSLFQLGSFQEGTMLEVDSSGECQVNYAPRNDGKIITKSKSNCSSMDNTGRFNQINRMLGVELSSISNIEYFIENDVIKSAVASEKWVALVNLDQSLSAVVEASQTLTFIEMNPSAAIEAPTVEALLTKLSENGALQFYGMPLGTIYESRQCSSTACKSAADVVREFGDNLKSALIGKSQASSAFREIVKAFRVSSKDVILNIFKDKKNAAIILTLIDVASAAQTVSAQKALMEFLKFTDVNDVEKQERYLLATALSTHPSETILSDLLTLFKKKVPNPNLRESISLALGAVTNTFYRSHDRHLSKIVTDIQSTFITFLDNCKDVPCRLMIIRSLANAGLPDTVDTLLKYAQTSPEGIVSEATLRALRRIEDKLITSKVKEVLGEIFHEKRRGYDTAVRSQALSILLRAEPTQQELHDILMTSADPWNTDYSLYIQARLFNDLKRNENIRKKLTESLKEVNVSNYHMLAPQGKSLAFTSQLAESPSTTYFMYVENGRSGIMKRSGMDINVENQKETLPLYSFGIHAMGLENMIAEEADPSEKDVEVTAGMSLDMIDVSLRPITFFTGQSGLMSAVWNAPSEPVSAFQTNFLLQDHSERIHLHNGLIAELDILGTVSLDLSGSLSVSLWNKNSKTLIKNSGALSIQGSLQILTSSFHVKVEMSAQGASCIDFRTDVDFYDGVKMCLQMSRPDFIYRKTITRYESARGISAAHRSVVSRATKVNAMSYPLPASNSAKCKLMFPTEQ